MEANKEKHYRIVYQVENLSHGSLCQNTTHKQHTCINSLSPKHLKANLKENGSLETCGLISSFLYAILGLLFFNLLIVAKAQNPSSS